MNGKLRMTIRRTPSLTNQFVFDKDNPSVDDMLNKLVKQGEISREVFGHIKEEKDGK